MPDDSSNPLQQHSEDSTTSIEQPLVELAAEDMPELQVQPTSNQHSSSSSTHDRRPRGANAPTPNAKEIARALPNNTDAEKGVLSAMLQSPKENIGDAVENSVLKHSMSLLMPPSLS